MAASNAERYARKLQVFRTPGLLVSQENNAIGWRGASPHRRASLRIFAVCHVDDLCKAKGTLQGGDTIESTQKMRKLGAAAGVGPKEHSAREGAPEPMAPV